MICLGILSVREDNGERKTKRIQFREKERYGGNCPVVVAEISLSKSELQKKRPWQRNRLFRKGEKFLKRRGANILSPTLAWEVQPESFGVYSGMVELPLHPLDMPEACKELLSEVKESPLGKTGWVLDVTCSSACLPLLEVMSQKVQYLGVVTKEREKAEVLEELLCREYGVNLEIQSVLPWREREAAVLANVDAGEIHLSGKMVRNGKRMTLDFKDYPVNLERLVKQHPELRNVLSFHSWCRRKSG